MFYTPFTDEQKQLANSVDLAAFLRQRGETLREAGSEQKLVYTDASGTHDSITIRGSTWFDHKNQAGGGAIRFMQHFYGMDFPSAMNALLGGAAAVSHSPPQEKSAEKKKEFRLPKANSDMHRVFAYLIKQRFISSEIISHFAHERMIFEDFPHHNAVFVGFDETGVPRQAHLRATNSFGTPFRMTCAGSDTRYSFAHFGDSAKLFVFEAPIDLLSYLTLYPQNWQEHSYLSLNGVYESALLHALETHQNLREIVLCTDHDVGGIEAAERLSDLLPTLGDWSVYRHTPSMKDWNEMLKQKNGVDALPAVSHPRRSMYLFHVDNLQPVKCHPERLEMQLRTAVETQQYQYLAEYALACSAFFAPKSSFEAMQRRLKSAYRAYADKDNLACKQEKLKREYHAATAFLGQQAQTREESAQMSEAMLRLADSAVRVMTEEALAEQQTVQKAEKQPAVGAVNLEFGYPLSAQCIP